MHQRQRIAIITDLLKKNGFVTVKYLTEELHYSTATVNRDLNLMQKQKLIKRSYGGAELTEEKNVPMIFRYNKMRPAKNKIGKAAAEFIRDGDTVFIDGSTTAQYIGKYITDKKDLTVITNNISLAAYLSEYNITAICLGGTVTEPPSMCYGPETVENARRYGADKCFFSSAAFTETGEIGCADDDLYLLMLRAMTEHSKEKFYLVDHEKLVPSCKRYLGTLADADTVITDHRFPEEIKKRYENTVFAEV